MNSKVEKDVSTREGWLTSMVTMLTPIFNDRGYEIPLNIRVSCGWTTGAKSIGQCWSVQCSADGTNEIFISPTLDDGLQVAAVLVHELVHAIVNHGLDVSDGHGSKFSKCARAVGLEGKLTATVAGERLIEQIKPMMQILGPYPHASLNKTNSPTRKQSTRMKKVICPECEYTVRTTEKWIEKGLPTCVCGTEMVAEEKAE